MSTYFPSGKGLAENRNWFVVDAKGKTVGRLATEVARLIQPRRMSDILAQMTPESAQKLTVELATRAHSEPKPPTPQDLPKIEERPSGS